MAGLVAAIPALLDLTGLRYKGVDADDTLDVTVQISRLTKLKLPKHAAMESRAGFDSQSQHDRSATMRHCMAPARLMSRPIVI